MVRKTATGTLICALSIAVFIGWGTNSLSAGYWPTHGWRTATPEAQGMDSGILAGMVRTIRDEQLNVDSITTVRNGYLVLEGFG